MKKNQKYYTGKKSTAYLIEKILKKDPETPMKDITAFVAAGQGRKVTSMVSGSQVSKAKRKLGIEVKTQVNSGPKSNPTMFQVIGTINAEELSRESLVNMNKILGFINDL